MSPRRSALLLWCVLALLLPLPVVVEQWGWWPLVRLLMFCVETGFDLMRSAQLLLWTLLLLLLAVAYCIAARSLPPKWAGALVGLLCWALLVGLSSSALYRPPFSPGEPLTFRNLYQTANATEELP